MAGTMPSTSPTMRGPGLTATIRYSRCSAKSFQGRPRTHRTHRRRYPILTDCRVDFVRYEDEDGGYDAVDVTDDAWTWIDSNDSLFSLFRENKAVPELTELTEDDIQF